MPTEVFSAAGSFDWEVPAGITSITVKAWGAGGSHSSVGAGQDGGGGGYVTAELPVTAGETLTVVVGDGGRAASGSSGGASAISPGGNGGRGGGGGASGLLRASTRLLIAPGGGGGGATGAGGPGGGLVGATGGAPSGGGGGTQSTGGTGTGGGSDGTSSSGGNGVVTVGAGGGGGYYGGGGSGFAGGGWGGAGGGSALVPAGGSTVPGSGANAGNNGDPDYAGNAGRGGISTALNGMPGRIVIIYEDPSIDADAAISDAGETLEASGDLAIAGDAGIGDAGETVEAAGNLIIAGSVTADSGETMAATGELLISGAGVADDAGEALGATGELPLDGLAAIDDAGETLAAGGALSERVATAALQDAGETIGATGDLPLEGAADLEDAGEALAAAGELPLEGAAAIEDAGETVASAAIFWDRSGVTAIEDAGEAVAAAGDPIIGGAAAAEDAGEAMAAAAELEVAAEAAIADAGEVLTADAALAIGGAAAIADAGEAMAAEGALLILGTAAVEDAGETVAGAGAFLAVGDAAVTDAGESLAAEGGTSVEGAGAVEDAGERLGDGPASPLRYYLAELDYYDVDAGEVRTYYATDGRGLATGPDDEPANVFYEPVLQLPDGVIYGRSVFGDGLTAGASQIEIADGIGLLNADGALDWMLAHGWDARGFRLYRIQEGQARDKAVLILSLVTEQLLPVLEMGAGSGDARMVVRLKDPLATFDVPFAAEKYLGTNVGPAGLEGTADDIKGLPKEDLYGKVFEVPARLVNASLLIYSVATGAVAQIAAVYDSGVELEAEGDVATLGELEAASPSSGAYVTCIAAGKVKLGASPAGAITADVEGTAEPVNTNDVVHFVGGGGQNQWLSRTSDDGPVIPNAPEGDRVSFTVSMWIRPDNVGNRWPWSAGYTADSEYHQFALRYQTDGRLFLYQAVDTSARVSASYSGFAADEWMHVLGSYRVLPGGSFGGIPSLQLAINGTLVSTGTSSFPTSFIWRDLEHFLVGRDSSFAAFNEYNGGMAEFFFILGHADDLTDPDAIAKFIDGDGYPADLGPNGGRPFSALPHVYLRGGPERFPLNLGTAGRFEVIDGPLERADSSPYPELVPGPGGIVTAPAIIRRAALDRVQWPADRIDETAFAAAELAAPEDVGIWVGTEQSVRDVLDEVAQSAAVAWWVRATGDLAAARFDLPVGPPVMWLDEGNLIELEALPIYDLGYGTPVHSVVVERRKIYSVQDGNGLAGSVDAERKAYLAQEYRRGDPVQDRTILVPHPSSPELVIRTLITNDADADAFAADRLDLYRRRLYRWRARTPLAGRALHVDLMDTVGLRMGRFAHQGGRLYRVLGHRPAWRAGWLELDIWGGVAA